MALEFGKLFRRDWPIRLRLASLPVQKKSAGEPWNVGWHRSDLPEGSRQARYVFASKTTGRRRELSDAEYRALDALAPPHGGGFQ
jgi:hypothetical protein